jgi:hypothetical protein
MRMQKRAGATTALLLAAAAGCGGTTTATRTVTVTRTVPSAPSATGDQRIYGRIKSMRRTGDRFELRFDPAWLVGGVTANVAHAEDTGIVCRPSACPAVANDNYVVDEAHRLLVFTVPAGVRGSVLEKGGSNGFLGSTITATQLAQLVDGERPVRLFEPLSTGVWILVHSDSVRTFAQQYHP